MRNFANERCRENPNTFLTNNIFSEYRAVYEKIWKNIVQPNKSQTTI